MQRNRLQREQRLIETVGEIVATEGFDQLRINKIASKAGVNKMLIYRYFGGLDGLVDAYLKQTKLVVSAPPIDIERLRTAPLHEVFQACNDYLVTEFRLLRNDITAQEFLKADLLNVVGNSNPTASEKEGQVRKMIDELSKIIGTKHGHAFAALIISGLTLLTLSAQQQKVVFGIDLQTDEGWAEIETTLGNLFRGAYLFTEERIEAEQALATAEKKA